MKSMDMFSENSKEEFYLMNKDTKILKFEFQLIMGLESYEITEVYSNKYPIGFSKIEAWVESRKAPKNRENIKELLIQLGCTTTIGFIRVTHALSLIDTFWVKPVSSLLIWDKVNLYTNKFNEDISRIAFEGGLYGLGLPSTSPEFTTDGTFPKCWHRDRYTGELYLLKGSSNISNNEPYSEYYASQIAKLICTNSVDYDLKMFKGELVCSCNIFTSENIGYAPIYSVLDGSVSGLGISKYYHSIGCYEKFCEMLILDALILNTDRHSGNHGIIFNTSTMEPLDMAPIFDHNISLLCYTITQDFTSGIDNYISTLTPRIGNDFIEVAKGFLTPSLRKKLINMKGFTFKRHSKYNLEEWRLIELERIVNKQIDRILS